MMQITPLVRNFFAEKLKRTQSGDTAAAIEFVEKNVSNEKTQSSMSDKKENNT